MPQTRRSFVANFPPRPLQAPGGVAALFGSRGSAAIAQAAMLVSVFWGLLGLPPVAGAQSVVGTVPAGSGPQTAAMNPVTNKIYVANNGGTTVTVIDGATNASATVTVGTNPIAVAVNPLTNRIYVANSNSNSLTVIDGTTNATKTVSVGTSPIAVAVNPITNQIYVANQSSKSVTVIDGATNATITTVTVGNFPMALAINPASNQIYVANYGDGTVTMIDGATNATTTVSVGSLPIAVAVNPVTNKIYVANTGSGNNVTVIDGATNATSTVSAGSGPFAVAVNSVTNQIYVTNFNSSTVTVIDGATNTTSTVSVGTNPIAVAVNPVTNQVYVANYAAGNPGVGTVMVIDGATNAASTLSVGSGPVAIGVNPVTNQIYVANNNNNNSGNVTVIDGAKNATLTVSAGSGPYAVAVNSATNQIYVANLYGNVTVIDGATDATLTVSAGSYPWAIAVNPVTNQIYVANYKSDNVTVIDGATNATTTVSAGSGPWAITVNPVTNQIYVANYKSDNVTMIDGATNATTMVSAGSSPDAIAVNPVTNQIYVANYGSANVTVIDGATNATTTISAGSSPEAVAVNPVTNQIYVANENSGNVTVIDGATTATTTVSVGSGPLAIAVNPVTNEIYVANFYSSNVTVIDGATNATAMVSAGNNPQAVTVNPVTNRIYVANPGSGNNMTVIDGATNATRTVSAGDNPQAIAVNPVTNRVYVANNASNNVTAIDVDGSQPVPLAVTAAGVSDSLTVNRTSIFITVNATPAFTATVTSDFTNFPAYNGLSAVNPAPANLYYWDDDGSMTGWNPATVIGAPYQNPAQYTIMLPQQSLGVHTLYLFADYGDEGDGISSSAGVGSSPVISNLQAVSYAVLPAPTTTTLTANVNPQNAGTAVKFTAAVTPGTGRTALPTGSVYFYDGSTLLGESTLMPNGSAYMATYVWPAVDGSHTIAALYTGDGNYASSTATLTETVESAPAAIDIVAGNNQTSVLGTAFTYSLEVLVTDADNIPLPNVAVNFSGTGLSFSSGGVAVTDANGKASVAATPTASGTLNATASIAGLAATAIFTETGTGSSQQTPVITWPTPAVIVYGTALSGTQLNATASYSGTNVPGTFTYTPVSGTVPGVGAQTLRVTFTPNDLTTYTTATATVTLQVTQANPMLTWAAPTAITYGTALSATQLNATASYNGTAVAGGFIYSPAAGTVLTAGTQTLSVTFTPSDTTNYVIATTTVSIVVDQATPSLNWTAPAGMTFGMPLTSTQLNATASVPGQFAYTPALGAVLGAGTQTLGVSFTPDDTANYKSTSTTVSIAVGKATTIITWIAPAAIQYGTALSATQLNATANVAGGFTYSPAAGTVLGAGSQTLTVTFTPIDTTDYTSPVTVTTPLIVTKATPAISWATPTSIPYGTGLDAAQLNATANVAGNFSYLPTAGTVPGAGSQALSATFTPTDTTDYGTATATVTLSVTSAAPAITWMTPTVISYGTPLGSAQLNASTNVAGAFSYSPGLGAILPAGTQTLAAIFTPSNTADYSSTTATTTIVVTQATPVITWETPASISAGVPLSATQLNATASVAGSFTYSPAAGTTLPAGTTTLTATFTSADTTDYLSPVTATVKLTVTEADFSVSASPAQQVITSGNSPEYVITVAPLSGAFSSVVTFSASGLPTGFTASFSPSSVTPGNAAANTTMTLNASSTNAANHRPLLPVGGGIGVLAAMLAGFGLRRTRATARRLLVAVIALFSLGAAAVLTGCGGGGSGLTSYQNYPVTVTATSGSISHATEVIVTID